jgi:quercetin dioxygenase-like cupin family protein
VPKRDEQPAVIDLASRAQASGARGPVWAHGSTDLNVTLLVLTAGESLARHVNNEVDVLLVGIGGSGSVEVDGITHMLGAGQALLLPKGTTRAIRSAGGRFAYLSCHRRRGGLWPAGVPRPGEQPE